MIIYNSIITDSNDATTRWRRAQLYLRLGNKEQALLDIAQCAPELKDPEVYATFASVRSALEAEKGTANAEGRAQEIAQPELQAAAEGVDGKKRRRESDE